MSKGVDIVRTMWYYWLTTKAGNPQERKASIMANYEKGFQFKVVKTNLIGIVNGKFTDPIVNKELYSVDFYESDGRFYYHATVFPETIERNLELGAYEKHN